MASIVSKLARAAVATRTSPAALGGIAAGDRHLSLCQLRLYQTGGDIRVYPAGGPKSEEEKKAKPKSTVTSLGVDDKVLESDESMWDFYEYWCKHYGISRDRSVMLRRFKAFGDTARRVHVFNNTCTGGRCAVNHMADWTKEEKSQLRRKRLYQTGGDIRVSAAGGPKSEEEKAKPKSKVTSLGVDDKVLESDEAMWVFYEYWCKHYGISRDRSEMLRRFKAFGDTARRVHKFNNTCLNGKCAVNHMADWTKEYQDMPLNSSITLSRFVV